MAAAPADFRASDVATGKLTRDATLDLHLEPTEDVLAALTAERSGGSSDRRLRRRSGREHRTRKEKLARKGADLIVLNDISDPEIGFERPENAVTLIDSASNTTVPQAPKDQMADTILARVDQLRSKTASHSG